MTGRIRRHAPAHHPPGGGLEVGRRLLSLVLACTVLAVVGGFSGVAQAGNTGSKLTASTAGITQLNTLSAPKSDSGRLARSDKSLFHLSGSQLTPVVVKLDYDAIGSYRGYLPGYPATSPGTTNKSLKENKAAVDKYSTFIGKVDDKARSAVAKLIPQAKVTQSLKLAYGGVSALGPPDQISKPLQAPRGGAGEPGNPHQIPSGLSGATQLV